MALLPKPAKGTSAFWDSIEDQQFAMWMERIDRVITSRNDAGFGRDDFADAPWAQLYEDTFPGTTDQDIVDCLADADNIFWELEQLTRAEREA